MGFLSPRTKQSMISPSAMSSYLQTDALESPNIVLYGEFLSKFVKFVACNLNVVNRRKGSQNCFLDVFPRVW